MKNIKPGDLCVVKSGGEKIGFVVDELTANFVSGARVNLLQFRDDLTEFPYPKPDSWAPYVKPKKVSALREQVKLSDARFVSDEQMRQFARYEILPEDLNPSAKAPFEIALSFDFALTIDDLLAAVRKISDENDASRLRTWALGFYQFLLPSVKKAVDSDGKYYAEKTAPLTPCKLFSKSYDIAQDELDEEEEDEEPKEVKETEIFDSCFPTEESVLYDVCQRLLDFLVGYEFLCNPKYFKHDDDWFVGSPKYRAIVSHSLKPLEICVKNRDLPLVERYYDYYVKKNFVESAQDFQDRLNEDELALFVKFVDEFCELGDREAMEIKARACCEGNRTYKRDAFKARDLLLKLVEEKDADLDLFVLLANIYYEGSCNDGRPEFDKAFYYYAIAALDDDWNARIRLADMFRQGAYLPQKIDLYWRMIRKPYQEKFERLFEALEDNDDYPGFQDGRKIEAEFAEIALRVGDAYRDGIGVQEFWETALYYYYQADYANGGFGTRLEDKTDVDEELLEKDKDSLYARIKKAIREMEARALPGYFKEEEGYFKTERLEPFLKGTVPENTRFEACVKKLNDKKYLLKLKPLVKKGSFNLFLLTIPQLKSCSFQDEIVLEVEPGTVELDFKGDYASFIFDEYVEKTGKFRLNGKNVGEINAEFTYSWDVDFEDSTRTFVAVKFKNGYKTYDYLCDYDGVKAGDKVVVPTSHGDEIVEVQKVFERLDSELPLPLAAYKRIKGIVGK